MALTPSTMIALGTPMPAFSLGDPSGRTISGSDFGDQSVMLVAFWCNHCPYVKHLADHFASFSREFLGRGVAILAINSNDPATHPEDSPARMAEEITARGYAFPYLFDETQAVAASFGAACTPDFFVYDQARRLAYRGQYDSSRPGKGEPTGADLRAALEALLSGTAPSAEQRPSMGCNIKWRPECKPSYAQ